MIIVNLYCLHTKYYSKMVSVTKLDTRFAESVLKLI